MTPDDPVSIRMLQDIAKGERDMRAMAEERARSLIGLLTRLAYQLDGVMMEEIRRKDPLAPATWGPEEWEEHFKRATASAVHARWSPSDDAESERLQEQITELESENKRLRINLSNVHAPVVEPVRTEERTPDPDPKPKNGNGKNGLEAGWPKNWPACPDRFRSALAGAQLTDDRLRRAQMVLWMIASHGLSTYMEIANHVADAVGLKGGTSGSFHRLFKAMEKAGLIKMQVIQVASNSQRSRLMLVALAATGVDLVNAFGWKSVESEWERLRRLHQADTQTEHAGAILSLALNARRHGYTVELIPQVTGPAEPDVKLTRGSEIEYVEVELGTEKHRKWQNLVDLQGHVAFCAGSIEARMTIAAEVRLAKLKGKATDIESLIRISNEPEALIWLEEW